jgi:hypothetical protein
MPTLHLELPARVSKAELDGLQADLAPYGSVEELPPASYDLKSVMLGISFFSDVLQGADVLVDWLKRTPRGNRAVIRLADGRTFRLEATDLEAFRKSLKAAVKEL